MHVVAPEQLRPESPRSGTPHEAVYVADVVRLQHGYDRGRVGVEPRPQLSTSGTRGEWIEQDHFAL